MPRSRACWSARWRKRASRSSSAPCADATFGPMLMVGLGGITTELFRDVVYRPAPVSAAEAATMLSAAQGRAVAAGIPRRGKRGRPGAVRSDRASLAAGGAVARRHRRDRAQSGAGASGAGGDDRGCAGGEEIALVIPVRALARTRISMPQLRDSGSTRRRRVPE